MSKPKNKEGQSSDFNLNPSLLHISALVLNTDPQLLESIHVMTTAIEHKKKVELELFFPPSNQHTTDQATSGLYLSI